MVRHILHGELTTFFWGQAYGGSQEALLTAPVFAVVRLELARAPDRAALLSASPRSSSGASASG